MRSAAIIWALASRGPPWFRIAAIVANIWMNGTLHKDRLDEQAIYAPQHWPPAFALARTRPTASQVKSRPSITRDIPIMPRFSVRETKPSGTFELPPTQAHLSSRLST